MWSTASFLHAARRKIYQRSEDDFVALSPARAEENGVADKVVNAFALVPMSVSLMDVPTPPPANRAVTFRVKLNPEQPNGYVFRKANDRYEQILVSCLKNLLGELGRQKN